MHTLTNNLKRLTDDLALPGGRMVGSEGHGVARAFLVDQLAALGCEAFAAADYAFRICQTVVCGEFTKLTPQRGATSDFNVIIGE